MKKQFFLFIFISALVACSQKVSQDIQVDEVSPVEITSPTIPVDDAVTIGQLDNGLTYYIHQNAKPENKVSLRLVVNAGSILEDEKQLGLAHFMEHMNFNGTKNFKKNELVDYLQTVGVKFGAHLNAYTSFDETVYMLPIPSDDEEILEKGLLILEDWAHGALLTDEEIEKERGVVLEEYRIGLGADKRMLEKYIDKMMYGSKYAERLPIGTKEVLENFKPDELRRFYRDWYRPDLMAVVAVGDIDVEDMEARIKAHFGKIAPASPDAPNRKEFEVPNHQETFISVENDVEASTSSIQVMYKDPKPVKKMESEADYRESLKRSLFTSMLNSRLDEKRNSEDPPFVYGYSYYGGTWSRNKNAFQSVAMTSETDQMRGLTALLEENERIKRFGFQEAEFERAKKNQLARMERAFNERDKQESNRIVGRYVNHYLEGGALPSTEWRFETMKAILPTIQLEEISPLINDYLQDENRVVILTGPDKENVEKVDPAAINDLLTTISTVEIAPYEDANLASAMMAAPEQAGEVVQKEVNEELDITRVVLNNGVNIVFKKTDFKNDEVLMRAYSFGGTSLVSDEAYNEMNLALGGLTDAGVNGFSINDMRKINTGKIASVRPYIGSVSEGLNGSSTPKDLETLFQMTHLYFTSLNKDQAAFNSYIAKQKGFYTNLLSDPTTYFNDEFNKFLNQNNPRFNGFPKAEDWENANYDLAYETYKERFANAGDFTFFFVGNFDESNLVDLSTKYLATLPATDTKEGFKDLGIRPMKGTHSKTIERGGEQKSAVLISFVGETEYSEKANYHLQSLGEILSIKLIEQLREEKGGVYGAGARGGVYKYPYGQYSFSISFPCGPENAEALTEAALAEVKKIAENGPSEKDLNKIKETQLLEYKEDLKDNRAWLNHIYYSDYFQHDVESILKVEEEVAALSAEDIQKAAQKYLSGDYIVGTLMPKASN
ncbi:MAG: insulinase family protein [Saprospiraceae bacterium]|nr:insulinase family protein [Saprospiraceae bacterium]